MSIESEPRELIPAWSLADRLRKIRRDVLGLSQVDMANRIEQNVGAYQSWENGKAKPRDLIAVAKRIQLVTGVSAGWILGLDAQTAASETAPAARTTPTSVSTQSDRPSADEAARIRRQGPDAEKPS